MVRFSVKLLLLLVIGMSLGGCGTTSRTSLGTRVASTPVVSQPPAPLPPTAFPAHTAVASPVRNSTGTGRWHIQVLAHGFGNPDDIIALPDGRLLFSDFGNGSINVIWHGKVQPLVDHIADPEGMALLPDGRLIIAEQKTNRLWQVQLPAADRTSSLVQARLLRQLVNETGQPGIDGLAYHPQTGNLLVPDSPNGRLLEVSPDGGRQQVIAAGFVRPTGAMVLTDGSLVIADEYGNRVVKLFPNGRRQVLASIRNVDDVAGDQAGNILAIGLGDGILWQINAQTGNLHPLVSHLSGLQGLAVGADGSIFVVESAKNQILRLVWQ